MAWQNNGWLGRKARGELIETLSQVVDELYARLDRLAPEELEELDAYATQLERLRRIHRAEVDLLFFAHEYFSDVRNPENDGNWDGFDIATVNDAATFHREICGIIDEVSEVTRNAKVAVAAPRGHAKSSYLSKASPLREIVFRKRRYIIGISETPTVATANLEWIAGQLRTNRKLREDFGPMLDPKQQANPKDNSTEFIAWEPASDGSVARQLTLMQAASTGQALRGRNWNGSRPDMVICDDLEDARPGGNAATADQREKLKDWFSQTVMPLGDPKGKKTAFIYMGTIVHAESLLNIVIHKRADFRSTLYKAIIRDPDRMDLWEQCRAIYLDITKEPSERAVQAESFYGSHRVEMDEGAEVLWPEVQPIWKLLTWKWTEGSKAFNTEYQNTPLDEESQVFVPEKFRKFDESDLYDTNGRPLSLDYYGFWDVAAGKSARSDYNAIVTIGRDRRTGVIYVIDAWAKKCPSHEALDVAVDKIAEFGHTLFAVETIGAGHDMYRQLRDRIVKEGVFGAKLKPIAHHGAKKEKRIEALEPIIESGFLRFKENQTLLFEQMEQFPTATHDDLPDSLAGAVDLAGGTRRRRAWRSKPPGL